MKPIHLILIAVSALLLLALGSYLFLDERLFMRFVDLQPTIHENPWMSPLRELGKAWLPVWLMLILLLTTMQVRPALAVVLAILLVVPLVTPAKFIVARPRPLQREQLMQQPEAEQGIERAQSSFPSGDTATAFAVATALTPYVVRASVPVSRFAVPMLFSLAGLVGMMRVTVMKHYVSDVLVGAAFGITAGYLAWRLIERHPNLRPHLYTTPIARVITFMIILALPFLAGIENVNPIQHFLNQYWMLIPILAACGIYHGRCANRQTQNTAETAGEKAFFSHKQTR